MKNLKWLPRRKTGVLECYPTNDLSYGNDVLVVVVNPGGDRWQSEVVDDFMSEVLVRMDEVSGGRDIQYIVCEGVIRSDSAKYKVLIEKHGFARDKKKFNNKLFKKL